MKQNFGLDGSSADFTLEYKKSAWLRIIAKKKAFFKISCTIKIGGFTKLRVGCFLKRISPKWN